MGLLAALLVAGAAPAGSGAVARVADAGRSGRRGPGEEPTTTVTVDGRRLGPSFQGIGAISGGGGNCRYLIDYPAKARRAILDELSSPQRGAALSLLTIEIGGDATSADGAEPSVEESPGQLTCRAGYELWLARQAAARPGHLPLRPLPPVRRDGPRRRR